MGGDVGKALDPTSGGFLGTDKIGLGSTLGRGLGDFSTFGFSELGRRDPFLLPVNNPLGRGSFGNNLGAPDASPYIPGPFTLDQGQFNSDRAAIAGEGQKQFNDTNAFINSDAAARSAARDQLANVLNTQAKNSFSQMLPDIAENSQAAHLYDSTGYGQEVARQQAALESGIQSQLGQQGVQDIYNTSNQRAAALQGQQGFGSAALQRGLSMEDQINNANISKTLGQVFAPQPPSGKSQFGTTAQGIGALAPWAKLGKSAGAGAAAGGAPGAALAAASDLGSLA